MDLLAIILFFWARWLSKRAGAPPWLRYLPPAIALMFLVSLVGTLGGLAYAFWAVESIEAANKATYLANGISFAMNFTAAALVFDALVLLTLIAATLRRTP